MIRSSVSQLKRTVGAPTALHYYANLVPFPDPFVIAACFHSDYPAEQLLAGLRSLHRLLSDLYQAGVERPETLIPSAGPGDKKVLKDADFCAYPRLLFALGLYGNCVENNNQTVLALESSVLADFCTRARIPAYEPFFLTLADFGLVCLPAQPLTFVYPADPNLLPALTLFARACRPLTQKDVNPPVEFLRADLGLLQINRKKVRPVPLDPEEAFRTLADGREATFIRQLDAWARSAGYTAQTICTGVQRSEFRAKYSRAKPNRTLFGFNVEARQLHMHLNFNHTDRILPTLAQTPRTFRELFCEKCACANCGACQDGPLQVELDDHLRHLCGFAYLNLPELCPEHYEAIQQLIKAQDQLLKAEADSK